ncbi:ALK tyrosine kinase receptor-like [Ruditapes philippinarum]|uniref:ALK tyrosine kinase receptor-like n=1 Tax=Ruditapes philippinarum TaxID=129788 RepID=UPI00295A8A97|nr:ALK tyrosine kinase receptor-like [Ruditapes philippinarum]
MQGQYILSMFTIMGCFIGCVSAGVGGFSSTSSSFRDEDEEDDGPKKTLALIILLGCIGAIFLTIFSMCIVCTYGSYFGVHIQRGRRGRMVFINTNGQSTMPTVFQTNTVQTGMHVNDAQISQLEAQNRLLQQQLDLQRQMFEQQQQQQQQQQTQYSTGVYPPPPPSYPGFSTTGPTAPPPNYYDVK